MKKLIPLSSISFLIQCSRCGTSNHMRKIVEVDEANLGSHGTEGKSWSASHSGDNPGYHEGFESYHNFYCAECGSAITITIKNERNSDVDEGLINPQRDIQKIYNGAVNMFRQYFPTEGIPSIDPYAPDIDILRLEGAMALLTRVYDDFHRTDVNLYRLSRFIGDDLGSLLRERRNLYNNE